MGLDIARHEPSFLGFQIGLRECREVHMPTRQRDARRFFVAVKKLGVDAVDRVEVVVQPPRLVGHLAQHVWQVHFRPGR